MKPFDYNSMLYKFFLVIIIGMISPMVDASYFAPSDSFRFEGSVFNGKTNISGVSINIYLNNSKVASALTNRYGSFKVFLKHNQTYIFEFSKQGYITQQFQISTRVTDKVLKEGGIGEAFQNEYEILEYYEGVNIDAFNKPIRYFVFNEKSFFFEEDLKKTQTGQINAVKTSITQIKDKLAATELKNGDDLFKKQKYGEAFLAYNNALELNPNIDISDKIKVTKKMMRGQQGFEADYKENIKKADELFSSKQYANAKEKYKKALSMKPEDPYPANRLIIIDSLTTLTYLANKKEYDKLIAIADKYFKENMLENAQHYYESALALQVDLKYPQKRIDVIKTTVAAEKKKKENETRALDNQYNGLINKANEFLSESDYEKALDLFNKALELKPDDSYTLGQIDKVRRLQEEVNLEKIRKQKEQDYNGTITLGDKAFKAKDYKQALIYYNSALKIKPSEKYPALRIREIDSIIYQVTAEKSKDVIVDSGTVEKPDSGQLTAENVKQEVDSLLASAEKLENEGDKIGASKTYMDVAHLYHTNAQFENAMTFLKKSFALMQQLDDKPGQATVLNNIASVYYDSGQYRQSIETYKEALTIKKGLGDEAGQVEVLTELGDVYENTYQYEAATETLLQALEIQQKMGNNEAVSETSDKLGGVYYSQGDYQNAIGYFNKALNIAKASDDKSLAGSLFNSIGVTYYKTGKYDEAINFLNQSAEIDKAADNKKNLSLTYNNIGNINFNWNKYDKAIEFYQLSLGLKKELNFEHGIAASLYNIGNTYLELRNYPKAKEFFNASLDLANKLRFTEVIQLTYKSLSRLYENMNDYQNATNSYKSFISVIGPGMVSEGQFSEMGATYVRESKLIRSLRRDLERQKFLTDYQTLQTLQKQKELQVKEMELKGQKEKNLRNKILLGFSLFLLAFAGFLAFQFHLRYVQKKKFSEVISFQKKEIMDSINYASRIQKAVSIPGEQIKQVFPESFIFNRPKSLVSGDYFYMTTKGNKIYVAVADCTGHGVPGAFMSMLGISLMKEVLSQEKELSANVVLNDLRDGLIKALHQTGRDDEANDGMDIAFCVIDFVNMGLEFSGANNPCYIIRDKKLIELRADRMPIGIHPLMESFKCIPSRLEKGDVIYMFSDGFKDQIGEITLKKFMAKRFSELLINISIEAMDNQAALLAEAFTAWQGNMEQTDDILVAGIKV